MPARSRRGDALPPWSLLPAEVPDECPEKHRGVSPRLSREGSVCPGHDDRPDIFIVIVDGNVGAIAYALVLPGDGKIIG
jgi:hypothetical protein